MIDLAAAAVLVRELTEERLGHAQPRRQVAGERHGAGAAAPSPLPSARPPRRAWLLRVASLVTQRSSEETWPRGRSRTSGC
jgi:hypothetical protein